MAALAAEAAEAGEKKTQKSKIKSQNYNLKVKKFLVSVLRFEF